MGRKKSAPVINGTDKLWKVMPNPCGRPRLYKSPAKLWEKALEYFQWVDDNPWQIKQGVSSITSRKGKGEEDKEKSDNSMRQSVQVLQKPYTLFGFQAFAGIYKWADFKKNYAEQPGFLEVIYAIEEAIRSQQITGAMLHQFDSNLTARINNIADNTKTELTGKDGEPLALPKLSDDDLKKIAEINAQL